MTVFEAKKIAAETLENSKSTSPSLDAQVLLYHILNCTKTELLLSAKENFPDEKITILNNALELRKQGLPVAYITGHKEFFGYDFFVSPDVLIPKPDTEILVERAIEVILEKINSRKNSILSICDMCTGSGCVALSILKNIIDEKKVPEERLPKFLLADISDAALKIAQKNASSLFKNYSPFVKSRISFCHTNLFEVIPFSFDVIVTNPPYVPAKLTEELLQDGRSEPRLALNGDVSLNGDDSKTNDGLEVIRNLIPQAKEHLSPLGTLLMETGEYNAQKAAKTAKSYGFKTSIIKDLEGQLRVVEANL